MDIANADGNYNGNNSDRENPIQNKIVSSEKKSLFNILEILPTEKRGVVGYTIGGCEPFDVEDITYKGRLTTKAELKQAYMDAIVNPTPGTDQANQMGSLNSGLGRMLWDIDQKIAECSSNPFKFETGQVYSGYYKRVANNKGVYCIDNPKTADQIVKSRFEAPGRSDYNYIFVYDQSSPNPDEDITVTGEKRVRYINQEIFIKKWLGKDPSIKENMQFEVTTRTPVTVSLPDIEKADLILINNNTKGTDHYYYALRLKNKIAGADENVDSQINEDWGLHYYSPEDDGVITPRENRLDFNDFEKVIRIYERIVVREDCAIVVEKNCCTTAGGGEIQAINTNIRKLMFMLFYVKADGTLQAGRDLFTDFFKRYTSEPGTEYLEKRKLHLADPTHYPVDYRSAWLKRNGKDPTKPEYYYMHMKTDNHVGHPLVINRDDCITGVKTEVVNVNIETEDGQKTVPVTLPVLSGNSITPLHDADVIDTMKLEIRTNDNGMFDDAGFTFWDGIERDSEVTDEEEVVPPRDKKIYYQIDGEYRYRYCYNSMSNTTDYIYIDNDGRLIVDTKYSSDQNYNQNDYWKYWYKIDADFYPIDGNTFRRRKWVGKIWDVDDPWPWDSSHSEAYLEEWLMHRKTEGDIYDCNMHMWYDYGADAKSYGGKVYMTVQSPPFGKTYKNQSLMGENGFFKDTWIKDALSGRVIKREETDINHIIYNSEVDYYFSMNIINGDGFNKKSAPGQNNKVLYYNQYEVKKNDSGEVVEYPDIPLQIKIKSTCPIVSIAMKKDGAPNTLISYSFNNYDVTKAKKNISGTSGSKTLELTSEKNDGAYISKTASDTPIYSFEGVISSNDVALSEFYKNRNTKLKVIMTVILPNDTEKSVEDTITIVKLDFFMLD